MSESAVESHHWCESSMSTAGKSSMKPSGESSVKSSGKPTGETSIICRKSVGNDRRQWYELLHGLRHPGR
jgi:hypothetical protein